MVDGVTTHPRSRQVLVHGLALVLVGLLSGFVVPHTPHPRLAVGAHIQLVSNGMLFVVMAVVLTVVPHRVGPKAAAVMVLAAWLTWGMGLSEIANAWWGTTQMLPIAAGQARAQGGLPWQEMVVKLTHIAAGLGLVVAWALLALGVRQRREDAGTAGR
jgi:hypothetical protein